MTPRISQTEVDEDALSKCHILDSRRYTQCYMLHNIVVGPPLRAYTVSVWPRYPDEYEQRMTYAQRLSMLVYPKPVVACSSRLAPWGQGTKWCSTKVALTPLELPGSQRKQHKIKLERASVVERGGVTYATLLLPRWKQRTWQRLHRGDMV